jgi:hypothetical protein
MKGPQVPVERQIIEIFCENISKLYYTTDSLRILERYFPMQIRYIGHGRRGRHDIAMYLCSVNMRVRLNN